MPNYLEIHAQMYKLLSGQIRTDAHIMHTCMHPCMRIHRSKVVTTMSCRQATSLRHDTGFCQAGLTKSSVMT